MPRPHRWSRDAVLAAASRQHNLLTAAQLVDLGVTRASLSRSNQLGGMFSRVLLGVHRVDGRGTLTRDQGDMAALLYAGHESVLTGTGLLRRRGVRAASAASLRGDDRLQVLVPHEVHRA